MLLGIRYGPHRHVIDRPPALDLQLLQLLTQRRGGRPLLGNVGHGMFDHLQEVLVDAVLAQIRRRLGGDPQKLRTW
ncbi:hypothetical protein [Nocardia anaemiae]|uniref:hypothetical protein n=1 Tax=Nocardia anaemiae TaxID=263910 RepID=UPI0007A406A7|nr:hypothetical protein [Nocardia anaemiae]